MKKGVGAKGFSKEYWERNYSEPETMDGIGNAKEHAAYLRAIFELDQIDISSVIDFGFGRGELFSAIMRTFLPYRAHGIEPSKEVFERANVEKMRPVSSTRLKLECLDIVSWCQRCQSQTRPRWYDLGVMTSVAQYLSEQELDFALPLLSRQVKYLYFTVPTNRELDRQIEDLEFKDEYAYRRSREFYLRKLRKHFTVVSSRVLESRHHFDESSTFFTDLLFRF